MTEWPRRSGPEDPGPLQELKTPADQEWIEHAAGRLLDLFAKRVPGASADVVVESAENLASLLQERAYDIALGVRPAAPAGTPGTRAGLACIPLLRHQSALVTAPGHPLARLPGPVSLAGLLDRPWFAGPEGIQDTAEEGRWLASTGLAPEIIRLSSETEALAAVRAGAGLMLAHGHIVRAELQGGALVRLPVAGTPVTGLGWASTLDNHRNTTMAQTLQRFAGTADATAAMVAPGGSRGLERRGSMFHVAFVELRQSGKGWFQYPGFRVSLCGTLVSVLTIVGKLIH